MKKIAVHLAEGFEEIEAVSIIDVLRRAGLDVVTVSVTGRKMVSGSHRIRIEADQLFEEMDYGDTGMLILPGGMPGSKNLAAHEGLKKKILEFHRQSKPLAAICAAPLVFGQLDILDGKKATCYPGFEPYLRGAEITGRAVETSQHIITGKGAGVAVQFALEIVENFLGKEKADDLAEKMVVRRAD